MFTCQLRDLSRNFPRKTPTDNCVFVLRTVKKILITAISENSSFLAKSLVEADYYNEWSVQRVITNISFKSALMPSCV